MEGMFQKVRRKWGPKVKVGAPVRMIAAAAATTTTINSVPGKSRTVGTLGKAETVARDEGRWLLRLSAGLMVQQSLSESVSLAFPDVGGWERVAIHWGITAFLIIAIIVYVRWDQKQREALGLDADGGASMEGAAEDLYKLERLNQTRLRVPPAPSYTTGTQGRAQDGMAPFGWQD